MVESPVKPSRNARKKAKKKERKKEKRNERAQDATAPEAAPVADVQYVSVRYDDADPASGEVLKEFEDVFARFASAELLTARRPDKNLKNPTDDSPRNDDDDDGGDRALGPSVVAVDEANANGQQEEKATALSRRKRKLLSRMSVAELKQVVARPEAVEAHDVTAGDPRLLVHLKSYRNAVPVPRHWCHKRRYLQGKRGVEKKPFVLPEFIAQTGIEKIRKAIEEAEALKKIKQKSRDRVAGRTGRMDVDYQVLHDAFFKWQTKPRLSGPGALYYEGKEYEVHMLEKKPGTLSASLKAALGMPDGAPPPWLINMQRYGPPPSYPNLRIPGLNAPIPDGATFGYHPGGWGKPPVDEYGIPLYGDVFGARAALQRQDAYVPDRTPWGEMAVHDDTDESEDDEEPLESSQQPSSAAAARRRERRAANRAASGEADDDEDPSLGGTETPFDGLQTPESAVDLRKRAGYDTPESSSGMQSTERVLYQIIDEAKVRSSAQAGALFASDKRYILPEDNDARKRGHDDDDDDDDASRKRKSDDASSDRSKRQKDFKF
mmetsp:Transcript_11933/g.35856  ORF Transcript_11933/g.35856 Transcript_11933/m.35856 type:complete len:549 (-) Transcript_11933:135-1781(-)